MDGATLRAGAVADVTRTRYPISLARAVMEKTLTFSWSVRAPTPFRAGRPSAGGARLLFTESRWLSLEKQLKKEGRPFRRVPRCSAPGAAVPSPRLRNR